MDAIDWDALRRDLADRIRLVRRELYGDHGGPMLAEALDLPVRTWNDYEGGVAIPSDVLLEFLQQTGTDPHWLLTGEGPKYRGGIESGPVD